MDITNENVVHEPRKESVQLRIMTRKRRVHYIADEILLDSEDSIVLDWCLKRRMLNKEKLGICLSNDELNEFNKIINPKKWYIIEKTKGYDVKIEMWALSSEILNENLLGMENPENYEIINEDELFNRLTEAV
jgi:hypothetical protein